MRALIVDDSSLMRKMIERALGMAGIALEEALQAGDGEEALNILRTEAAEGRKVGLIVSDINMPVMDGLTFLLQRRAEKLFEGVAVVMITTEGAEAMVRKAISAGALGYICKPFIPEQVRLQVTAALARASALPHAA